MTHNSTTIYSIYWFQLTRSRGAWPILPCGQDKPLTFQLTRSRGAWRRYLVETCEILLFQLTRSRGAWLHLLRLNCKNLHFNSHAHVERDYRAYIFFDSDINFNSHAHVERDVLDTLEKSAETEFQLTRSRGAWLYTSVNYFLCSNFNSHAHVERDWNTQTAGVKLEISTHTLTWSVTSQIQINFIII